MSLFKDLFSRNTDGVAEEVDLDSLLPHGTQLKILLVDDSRTVLVSVKKMLNKLGFECLTADNARDGIDIAKQQQPDLILMDVVMPEVNGFQATRMLRNLPETRFIPIIIISGNKMQTEQIWGKRLGANGFLPKPLNPRDLVRLVEEITSAGKVAAG